MTSPAVESNYDTDEPAAPKRIRKGRFLVLASSVTIKTGPKSKDAARLMRGRVYVLTDEYTDVDRLLALKAIVKAVKGTAHAPLTAQAARMAAGDPVEDPATAPVVTVLPITPDDAISAVPGALADGADL